MAFVQHALGWITGLPTVPVYVVTAAVLAAETGLLVGVLLPAEPLLLLVGYLVSTGRLGLVTALLVTTAAALTGDWLAYLFGRRLGLRGGRFVRHDRWARARTLFARHGGFAVAAGRWTAFVRTLTPRMAGAARLHPARFLIWDLVAVLIWVPGSVLAGDLAGASYAKLAGRISDATLVAFAVLVLAIAITLAVRRRSRGRVPVDASQRSRGRAANDNPAECKPR